jgi:hypothetical protein
MTYEGKNMNKSILTAYFKHIVEGSTGFSFKIVLSTFPVNLSTQYPTIKTGYCETKLKYIYLHFHSLHSDLQNCKLFSLSSLTHYNLVDINKL